MLIETGGPVQQTEQQTMQKTIEVHVEQPPKDWAVELLSGIVIAVVAGGIITMWRRKK